MLHNSVYAYIVNLETICCNSSARFDKETAAAVTSSSIETNCSSDAAALELIYLQVGHSILGHNKRDFLQSL